MQSSNPVFRRAEGFNGQGRTAPASGMTYPAYGSPSTSTYDPYSGTGYGGSTGPVRTDTDRGPMTIDTVVQKTAFTVGLTILVAAATWALTPQIDPATGACRAPLYLLAMLGAFGGFALSLANSFSGSSARARARLRSARGSVRRRLHKVIEAQFGGRHRGRRGPRHLRGGRRHLAAYKFFDIRVTPTFRKWVIAAMFGFVALRCSTSCSGLFHSVLRLQRLRRHGPGLQPRSASASACSC